MTNDNDTAYRFCSALVQCSSSKCRAKGYMAYIFNIYRDVVGDFYSGLFNVRQILYKAQAADNIFNPVNFYGPCSDIHI